ncbi:hypothetical protein Q9Q95_19390 [Sphingomonas sp. DG1-23]|uniref:hypothetical protein n=1 Tax=Sphingomonas sp. DG1-23 TaxID=3068316 RepID=UPI00273F5744|nr:hypothetical protein [Sphingomonas sp. DG1-23]MDP5281099.1 hypothetical protein [Sphingomonas sp. DG1-23]
MPFTPFHLGPGALLKAIGGDRFSFMIFGGTQVLMDIEPLVRMIRGDAVLHGTSHTVAGGFGVAIVAATAGRPVSNFALRQAGIGDQPISRKVALGSALVGAWSHIGLDAMMHGDMDPLWPIVRGNGILNVIPLGTLHALCFVAGLLGAGLLALRALRDAQ